MFLTCSGNGVCSNFKLRQHALIFCFSSCYWLLLSATVSQPKYSLCLSVCILSFSPVSLDLWPMNKKKIWWNKVLSSSDKELQV